MLYDAHNHLHDKRLRPQLEGILEQLEEHQIAQCVVNGTHPDDWDDVLELHQRYPHIIIPALGLHPWKVKDRPLDWFDRLQNYQRAHPFIGIGECGLDKWIQDPRFPEQQECFIAQLSLATEKNLPISIHCLKAWGPLLETLKKQALPERGIHLHGFGGSQETANELLHLGAYFSFCGYFLQSRKEAVRDVFANLPHDKLLIETDSPDMLPPKEHISHELDGTINSPLNLKSIAQQLAKIRGVTFPELAQLTEINFHRYFNHENNLKL